MTTILCVILAVVLIAFARTWLAFFSRGTLEMLWTRGSALLARERKAGPETDVGVGAVLGNRRPPHPPSGSKGIRRSLRIDG